MLQIDHHARAKMAWPILVERARKGGAPFTYGELCSLMGLHHRSAQWFLGVIQAYCQRHNFPPLQALAVNKRTRLPGKGYSGSRRSRVEHERALSNVRSMRWSKRAPDFTK